MKDDYKRAATADEIARMALLVDQGMREGAAGLSSGLEYEVGGYAETGELIELAKVVARYGGVYMSHIRDEADKSFDALQEAIAIGEGAHVAVQISHIKLGTVGVWRKSAEAIALIEAAQQRGVDVTADAYPYNAWSSTITVLVPNKRYDDPPSVETRARRRRRRRQRADRPPRRASGVRVPHAGRDGADQHNDAGRAVHPDRQGRRRRRGLHLDGGRRHPRVLPAAVGDGRRATAASRTRHPRGAGTFPRVLGRYVRDQQWLTLPEAIRKMTSAPAARLRLEGRGRLEPGAIADIVLFNPKTIVDRSTFTDPALLPTGVEKVFVGGELVWDGGKPTPARPGRVLMSGHTPDGHRRRRCTGWCRTGAGSPRRLQLGRSARHDASTRPAACSRSPAPSRR